MNLKNVLLCKYGPQMKASQLETLFGIGLLEIFKMISQRKGERFESDKAVNFSVPTHEVAAQIIAQETNTRDKSNSSELM